MNTSIMVKHHTFLEKVVNTHNKLFNGNCRNCFHFQKFKHPLQEIYYPNSAVGECRAMKKLIFKVQPPKCLGVLYEEK